MSLGAYDPKQALVLLVKEVCDQLDDLAALRKKGYPGTLSASLLRDTTAVLADLPEELQEQYFTYLATFTECLCPPVEQVSEESKDSSQKRQDQRKPKLAKAVKALRQVA